MPQKNKKTPPEILTFFEPRNDNFFQTIADCYGKLIENNFGDSAETFQIRETQGKDKFTFVDKFFNNYYNDLPFPACKFHVNLKHIECGSNRMTILTENQVKIIAKSIDGALTALETKLGTSKGKAIIDKIRKRHIWLEKVDKTIMKQDPKKLRYLNYLTTRIKKEIMNGAKRITFVRSKTNSDYDKLKRKIKPFPLTPCDAYQ
jgi:hypothetical protein